MPEITPSEWDRFLSNHPEAHILQTREWGEIKAVYGWKPVMVYSPASQEKPLIAALVLFRRLPFGMKVGYIAKGPVGFQPDELSQHFMKSFCLELDPLCRRERAIFLRVEPDAWEPESVTKNDRDGCTNSVPDGFQPGLHSIQPKQTLMIDLRGDEKDILARMKQKTRYNIRLAQKKGVRVFPSGDIDTFYSLLKRTGDRDSFGVHQLEYYRKVYESYSIRNQCLLLMAEYDGSLLAGLMVFSRGERAWYFYGASGDDYRDLMPTYLLQWEAMLWARQQGCEQYDLWGIPDASPQELEEDFTRRSDGLWGVYRFKRGFGGEICRSVGPWDRVYRPAIYRLYTWLTQIRSGRLHGD